MASKEAKIYIQIRPTVYGMFSNPAEASMNGKWIFFKKN